MWGVGVCQGRRKGDHHGACENDGPAGEDGNKGAVLTVIAAGGGGGETSRYCPIREVVGVPAGGTGVPGGSGCGPSSGLPHH